MLRRSERRDNIGAQCGPAMSERRGRWAHMDSRHQPGEKTASQSNPAAARGEPRPSPVRDACQRPSATPATTFRTSWSTTALEVRYGSVRRDAWIKVGVTEKCSAKASSDAFRAVSMASAKSRAAARRQLAVETRKLGARPRAIRGSLRPARSQNATSTAPMPPTTLRAKRDALVGRRKRALEACEPATVKLCVRATVPTLTGEPRRRRVALVDRPVQRHRRSSDCRPAGATCVDTVFHASSYSQPTLMPFSRSRGPWTCSGRLCTRSRAMMPA